MTKRRILEVLLVLAILGFFPTFNWVTRSGDRVVDVYADPSDGDCVVVTSKLEGWPRMRKDPQGVEVYDSEDRQPMVCDG